VEAEVASRTRRLSGQRIRDHKCWVQSATTPLGPVSQRTDQPRITVGKLECEKRSGKKFSVARAPSPRLRLPPLWAQKLSQSSIVGSARVRSATRYRAHNYGAGTSSYVISNRFLQRADYARVRPASSVAAQAGRDPGAALQQIMERLHRRTIDAWRSAIFAHRSVFVELVLICVSAWCTDLRGVQAFKVCAYLGPARFEDTASVFRLFVPVRQLFMSSTKPHPGTPGGSWWSVAYSPFFRGRDHSRV
jgi:hypothetical protein